MSLYARCYNEARTHLSLTKDAPIRRPIERFGRAIVEAHCRRPASSLRSSVLLGRHTQKRKQQGNLCAICHQTLQGIFHGNGDYTLAGIPLVSIAH